MLSLLRIGGIEEAGRSASLMSPGPGFARPSSLTSLRRAPSLLNPKWRVGVRALVHAVRSGSDPGGARRREVKEEPRAKPLAGDMSGGGHPQGQSHGANETNRTKRDHTWEN